MNALPSDDFEILQSLAPRKSDPSLQYLIDFVDVLSMEIGLIRSGPILWIVELV
jgi:hypothetical protein